MKKFSIGLVLVLLCSFVLVSCGGEDEEKTVYRSYFGLGFNVPSGTAGGPSYVEMFLLTADYKIDSGNSDWNSVVIYQYNNRQARVDNPESPKAVLVGRYPGTYATESAISSAPIVGLEYKVGVPSGNFTAGDWYVEWTHSYVNNRPGITRAGAPFKVWLNGAQPPAAATLPDMALVHNTESNPFTDASTGALYLFTEPYLYTP